MMRWHACQDAKPRLLPFPKSLARQKTEREFHARDAELSAKYPGKWKPMQPRYDTVQIALVPCRGWMLAYEGEPMTGPFKTRRDAMGWYLRSGR